MKRTISKLLGIAALAIAGICSISAPAQAASWSTPFTTNGVVCSTRIGGTATSYPENSMLQSCLVGTTLRESVRTKVLLEPLTTVRTLLNNAGVKIYLWDTWSQYKQFYNLSTLPAGVSASSTLGFTNQLGTERQIHIVEYLESGGNRIGVTSGVPGAVMHEIGHQMDVLWLPPSGLLYHSQVSANSIYYQKLMKDKAKINTYIPCVDIFKNDVDTNGVHVCAGSPLQLTPTYAAMKAPPQNLTNWDILQLLYPYYLTSETVISGTAYLQTFAETFSRITSAGQGAGQLDFYLFNDPFVCSRTYIIGWRNTGAAPANSSYQSWCQ